MITEDQLEQLCLGWFKETEWETIYGPDIEPEGQNQERDDFHQVVLTGRLLTQLHVINPHIPVTTLEEVAQSITKAESPVLIHSNRAFHKMLLEGVLVEYDDGHDKKTDHVQFIDFQNADNNQFLVVNQFTVQGTRQHRRPDIVVYINGLPLAVIELKNPADENADVWDAYNQLQTYKEEISDLFVFNEALVISDGITTRLGSLTANPERFMPWRTIKNENDKPILEYSLETLVRGFFDRDLLLDYIRYFTLFDQDGDTVIKLIAGYHQFHAAREAVRVTVIASAVQETGQLEVHEPIAKYGKNVVPGSRKGGVVWHTQDPENPSPCAAMRENSCSIPT